MGSISPCNILRLISNVSEEVAIQIAKKYRRRQPHMSFDALAQWSPREYPQSAYRPTPYISENESHVLAYIFAADSIGLSSFV